MKMQNAFLTNVQVEIKDLLAFITEEIYAKINLWMWVASQTLVLQL